MMRISIWHQFSSNHSAHFTVVGTFESPEKANVAAAELRKILAQIRKWWAELPSDTPDAVKKAREWHDKTETSELTPPEIELSREYQVDWPYSINWYSWASWDHDDDPISVFEHFVFVKNPHWYIYCGPQPFDQLAAKLGADVSLNVSESRTHPNEALLVDVRCKLPSDEKTANHLHEDFAEDFKVWLDVDNYLYYGYERRIKFPFNVNVGSWLFPPDVRIYEVEREGDDLYLYGINLVEVYSLPEALSKFTDFLTQEGCADIQFSFRSAPILGSKDEQEEP